MKANKYKLKLTEEQKGKLAIQFGCARWVYNNALNRKQEAYKKDKSNLSRYQLQSLLVIMKKDPETDWLKQAHSQVLQSALLHLDNAFRNFFSKRARFPRFKTKYGKQSCQYPQGVKIQDNLIFLPKIGWVKAIIHREAIGTIKTVTISKDATGDYFASVLLEDGVEKPKKVTHIETHIGLDMGIIDFITTSHDEKVSNPRFFNKQLKNLRYKQKQLSRKTQGSVRYAKAALLVAKSHQKVKNARNDFQHKLSFNLANNNHVVSIEDINMRGLSKNRKLARHLLDLGWHDFTLKLKYKQEDRGHYLVKIGRFFASSKTCHCCGNKLSELPLGIREWHCPSCDAVHDRDGNAAKNVDNQGILKIKAEGLTVSARGGIVNLSAMSRKLMLVKREAPFIAQA